jgi:hypothetical protein
VEWGIPDASQLNRLAGITQPTLVANGANDTMIPTINSRVLADHIPDARLRVYSDAGRYHEEVETTGRISALDTAEWRGEAGRRLGGLAEQKTRVVTVAGARDPVQTAHGVRRDLVQPVPGRHVAHPEWNFRRRWRGRPQPAASCRRFSADPS